jgi:DNA-binding MarR family transcriptional regulator
MDETARQAAMTDLYALPGHLLWRAAARVSREVDRVLPGSVDVHSYATLVALADHEPQSQASLAQMTGVSRTTLTSVANTLIAEDLAVRRRNPQDRRSYSLTRTPAGRSAVRRWAPHVVRLEEQLTASFADADAVRLRELLLRVAADDLDERTPRTLLASTGFLVTKAHQHTHREFAAALAPHGIEPRDFGTLRALRSVGPITQGDLAALLDVSPATVVTLVDHLGMRGLVSRERDEVDRRAYRLHLSPEAERVVDAGSVCSSTLLQDRIGTPGSTDREDLVRLLRHLLEDATSA